MAYAVPQDEENAGTVVQNGDSGNSGGAGSTGSSGTNSASSASAPVVTSTAGASNTGTTTGAVGNTPAPSGGGPSISTNQAGQAPAGGQPSSGNFTNIQKYLDSNASGANSLGDSLSNTVTGAVKSDTNAITGATNDFTNQVQSNTKSYDPNLVSSAISNPTQYLNNSNLSNLLSGTYSGPAAFSGSAQQGTAQTALNDADQTAKLAGSEGGRVQLLRQGSTDPQSLGDLNFNQFLVQNTLPALSKVQAAAQTAAPLDTNLANTGTQLDSAATKAATNNQAVADQAKSALNNGLSQYLQTLQGKVGAKVTADQANNQKLQQFLSGTGAYARPTVTPTQGQAAPSTAPAPAAGTPSLNLTGNPLTPQGAAQSGLLTKALGGFTPGGTKPVPATTPATTPAPATPPSTPADPALLAQLGLTQQQFDQLNSLNAQAKAAGANGVNLTDYFKGANDANLGIGNVASAQDQANYQALAQLAGNTGNNPFTAYGATTGPTFDTAGATTALNAQIQAQQAAAAQAANKGSVTNITNNNGSSGGSGILDVLGGAVASVFGGLF